VADFLKDYGRLPSLYASQGYDAAQLMAAAVRDVKGQIENKDAVLKAIKAAKFNSVRGPFRFNNNQYPVQDYYLRVITKNPEGRVTNRTLGKIFSDHADAYAASCKMK
jgi:branched-chain amino acid transport system substrate-binding protein